MAHGSMAHPRRREIVEIMTGRVPDDIFRELARTPTAGSVQTCRLLDLIKAEAVPEGLVGRAEARSASIGAAGAGVTCLLVHLEAGQSWTFRAEGAGSPAWIAVGRGAIDVDGAVRQGEIAIFKDGFEEIEAFAAHRGATFVIGAGDPPYAVRRAVGSA